MKFQGATEWVSCMQLLSTCFFRNSPSCIQLRTVQISSLGFTGSREDREISSKTDWSGLPPYVQSKQHTHHYTLFIKYCYNDGTNVRLVLWGEKQQPQLRSENLKPIDRLGNLVVYWRILLKLILNERCESVGWIYLNVRGNGSETWDL
jgi:hypothetical protein